MQKTGKRYHRYDMVDVCKYKWMSSLNVHLGVFRLIWLSLDKVVILGRGYLFILFNSCSVIIYLCWLNILFLLCLLLYRFLLRQLLLLLLGQYFTISSLRLFRSMYHCHVLSVGLEALVQHLWHRHPLSDLLCSQLGSPLLLCCRNQIPNVLPVNVLEGTRVVETRLSNEVRSKRVKARVQAVSDHVNISALNRCH